MCTVGKLSLSWNSSPQLKFFASAKIRRLSWNSSPPLKFVASAEICRLKTNAAWQNRRYETVHRRVKPSSTELLVLTQTAPHSYGFDPRCPFLGRSEGQLLVSNFASITRVSCSRCHRGILQSLDWTRLWKHRNFFSQTIAKIFK